MLVTRASLDHSQESNAWTLDIAKSCVPSERHIQADARTVKLADVIPLSLKVFYFEIFPTINMLNVGTNSTEQSNESLRLMPDAIRNIVDQMQAGSTLIIDTVPRHAFGLPAKQSNFDDNPFHNFFVPHAFIFAWHFAFHSLTKDEASLKAWDIEKTLQTLKADQKISDAHIPFIRDQYHRICTALPLCTEQHSETRKVVDTLKDYLDIVNSIADVEIFKTILEVAPRLSWIFYDLHWLTRKAEMRKFLQSLGLKDISFATGYNPLTKRRVSWVIKATK